MSSYTDSEPPSAAEPTAALTPEDIGDSWRHVSREGGPTFITFTGHATNSYDSVPETVSI